MRTFLKVIFLFIILILLAAVTFYSLQKDQISDEIRTYLTTRLSSELGHPVTIGSVKYIPFQSLYLKDITIIESFKHNKTIAKADNITITVDLLTLLKDKTLNTTITAMGLDMNDMICNGSIKTTSRSADTHINALDLSLINSVSVIESLVITDSFVLRNVFGIINVHNMTIPDGKLHFTMGELDYLANFTKSPNQSQAYGLSIRSENIGFNCILSTDANTLIVDDLIGMYHAIHFDLEGIVQDYLSKTPSCTFYGKTEIHLKSLAALPGKIGKLARGRDMTGVLLADVDINMEKMDKKLTTATAMIYADDLTIKNYKIKQLNAIASIANGHFSSTVKTSAYSGTFNSEFKTDIAQENKPYTLLLDISDIDYGSLIYDISKGETEIYGTLDANLSAKGFLSDSSSTTGDGTITISDANLGPMPILTPLLGDIYSGIQNVFVGPDTLNITSAFADFQIYDREIHTDNLTLIGDTLSIASEGYMTFDGNLDFSFENQFREAPLEEDEDWHITLRNAIISFGKFIGRTKLTGTTENPEWGM